MPLVKSDVRARKTREEQRFIRSLFPVVYIPFWKRDGTQFLSDDGHGYVCTATGTLKTQQGRRLNGTTDKIITTITNLPSGSADRTVMGWIKLIAMGAATGRYVFSWGEFLESKTFTLNTGNADTILSIITYAHNYTSTHALVVGKWHHFVAELSGTAVAIELDGMRQTGTLDATPNTTSSNLYIGCRVDENAGTFINMDGGELIVCNRLLKPQEKQQHRMLTKWRY